MRDLSGVAAKIAVELPREFPTRRGVLIPLAKSRARLASPQPRPTSPVNGAGGITGCRDDSKPPESFPGPQNFLDLDTVK